MKHVFGSIINLNNADVFTMMNEHSYAAFVGVLSNIYMKAHASGQFRTSPYKAALVVSPSMAKPYKNQPESSLERLKFIISHLRTPQGGIEIGIFVGNSSAFSGTSKIGLKHTVSQCWPIKREEQERELVTLNLPPPQLASGANKVRYFTRKTIDKSLSGHIVKPIDYNTPIHTVFSLLEKSKALVCYQGGTAWLGVCMGIPTIIVHPGNVANQLHLKTKLFGQDLGNINVLNQKGMIEHVRSHPREIHVNVKDLKGALNRL